MSDTTKVKISWKNQKNNLNRQAQSQKQFSMVRQAESQWDILIITIRSLIFFFVLLRTPT
jgi:hypothetical protein